MKLLLDTHALIWVVGNPGRLSGAARDAIANPDNDVLVSAVSTWEAAIKARAQKLALPGTPQQLLVELLQRGYLPLSITHEHAAAVYHLPLVHKDPFDRLLVAQCQVEQLTLVTADPALAAYGIPICW